MIIEDKGIILKATRFQESAFIVKCFLQNHGAINGLIKSSKISNLIAHGNIVHARWQGKIGTLGYYNLEPIQHIFASISASYNKILILNSVIELLDITLQQSDIQRNIFNITENFLEKLYVCNSEEMGYLFIQYLLFELNLLKESGFGLDLSQCVVSGSKENLVFVSPKSGSAVSASEGAPYANKLFRLPQFFLSENAIYYPEDINAGFIIMNHFIEKCLLSEYSITHTLYRKKVYDKFLAIVNYSIYPLH